MSNIQLVPLIGLYGGAIIGLFCLWLGRKMAVKKRGVDERYYSIWKDARAGSWIITLFAIYLLFSLHFFGIELSVSAVLGLLMLIHFIGWASLGFYKNIKG